MTYAYLVYYEGLLVAVFAKLYEAQHHVDKLRRKGFDDNELRIDRWYGDDHRGLAPKESI